MDKTKAALALATIFLCTASAQGAVDSVAWGGALQTGYAYGQNGQGWPDTWKDPLANQNRGGFYLRRLRASGLFQFDDTFAGNFVVDVPGPGPVPIVMEAYLSKQWKGYGFRAGKFRGAGLHSATGVDEFSQATVFKPHYARLWDQAKRLHLYRDFGVQVEKALLDGELSYRFFFHNANWQNVVLEVPNGEQGPSTQALGLDFAMEWKATGRNLLGGHFGALANRNWGEFLGSRGWWNAPFWLKSNPVVDASFHHLFHAGPLEVFTEGVAILSRIDPDPPYEDLITWGVSSRLGFAHHRRFRSYFRYEFADPTNGQDPDDALHLFSLGTRFLPVPDLQPGLFATLEYDHVREEGLRGLRHNDAIVLELQHSF